MQSRTPFRAPPRQRGAIVVVVAVVVVTLLLMVGLMLDLGRLYVVKTELQNAADACALSAARELNDLSTGATDRSRNAGVTVGNRNFVNLQNMPAGIQRADIRFSDTLDGALGDAVLASTRYVHCLAHASNPVRLPMVLMTLGGLIDVPMSATAVAKLTGSQSSCAIPLAMCTTAAAATPGLGFQVGTWYGGKLESGSAVMGAHDWVQFEGQGAADLKDLLAGPGFCGTRPERVDAAAGSKEGVDDAWNTRFGLYKGKFNNVDLFAPDRTGWAYTAARPAKNEKDPPIPGSWSAGASAYDDYVQRKNLTHDSFTPDSLLQDNGKPFNLPTPISPAQHAEKGQDRRMVVAPVIRCTDWAPNKKNLPVLDWACALLLHPIPGPLDSGEDNWAVQMEFRGLVSAGCSSSGFPGGSGTPVPTLVR